MRIGVFYDGGWWAHVSDYLAEVHPWRARPSLQGMADVLRWNIARHVGLSSCTVEQHYVRARTSTPSSSFEDVLDKAGVRRYDVPLEGGREKGADVLFALTAYERAVIGHLDVAVLLTGDADLVPLVLTLKRRRLHVLVPQIEVTLPDGVLRTAPSLTITATASPKLLDLLAAGLEPDYTGVYPFVEPVGSGQAAAADEPRGSITRWQGTSGFITDSRGGSWFVSRDSLPEGMHSLPVGTRVTFRGRPHRQPGKKYPEAYSVRPIG